MKARSPVKTECAVCLKAKENVLLLAKIGKFICVGCIDNYHFLAHLNENQPVAPTLYVGRDGKPAARQNSSCRQSRRNDMR